MGRMSWLCAPTTPPGTVVDTIGPRLAGFVLEGMMEGGTGRRGEARLAGDDVVARVRGITQQLALCRVDPSRSHRAGTENSMQGCRTYTQPFVVLCLKHSVRALSLAGDV